MRNHEELACGSMDFIPFPVSPGKAGAGMVPPTTGHAARQQKALSRFVRCLPPQEGFQNAPLKSPLRHPPVSGSTPRRKQGERSRVVELGTECPWPESVLLLS